MNVTSDAVCNTCQTSNGFSSAEQRSIIIMVVLASIILVLSYVGVLWYAIRTRFISDKYSSVVNNNEAFNGEEEEHDQPVQTMNNTRRTTS
jgi:hypothetical protein